MTTSDAMDVQIDGTTRELGQRLTDTGLGYSVRLRRRFDAPIEAVWAAITEPERLANWFGIVTGELRQGGQYAIEGNAHGAILACRRPNHFSVIWDFTGAPTELDIRLASAPDGGTLLELEHVAIIPEEYVAGVGQFAASWEMDMYVLDEYLRGSVLPEALQWAVGQNLGPVENLISRSIERWTEIAQAQGYGAAS